MGALGDELFDDPAELCLAVCDNVGIDLVGQAGGGCAVLV